jgi:pimeloyl-ACP methyl ester carboxylesterase
MPNVYIDGFKMHYDVAGEGAPLLLLHGLGSRCPSFLRPIASSPPIVAGMGNQTSLQAPIPSNCLPVTCWPC